MEPISLNSIYDVFSVVDGQDDGQPHNLRVGRVVVTPSAFTVLSDHMGLLKKLGGPVNAKNTKLWRSLCESSHSRCVSLEDIRQGLHPELLDEHQFPQVPQGHEPETNSWFALHRPELANPLLVNFIEGKAHLHGQPLSRLELESLAEGASIRHHRPMEKAEDGFRDLVKADMYLSEALKHLESAHQQGTLPEGVRDALHKAIFQDPLTGLRNQKAYQDEIGEPQPEGTAYVSLDGSDFKSINDTHGHKAGDDAIKSMGGAIRSALDEAVGPQHTQAYRAGGDEFQLVLPSHEHAAKFMRTLRGKLGDIPPVGGTHRLAMQGGIGHTPEHSDKALYAAKATKKGLGALPGQSQSNFHSMMPGHEGPIPLDPVTAEKPPEAPKPAEPSPAAPKP